MNQIKFIILTLILPFSYSSDEFIYKIGSFSWNNCGDSSDQVIIKTITIGPDPVNIPGNITFGLNMQIKTNQTSPLPLSLKIKKKVGFFWFDVPCENNIGSCDYDDFCVIWKKIFKCPPAFIKYHIPCNCPFTEGKYNLPAQQIGELKKGPMPKWMENGEYKIKLQLQNSKDQRLFCLDVNLDLKAS